MPANRPSLCPYSYHGLPVRYKESKSNPEHLNPSHLSEQNFTSEEDILNFSEIMDVSMFEDEAYITCLLKSGT